MAAGALTLAEVCHPMPLEHAGGDMCSEERGASPEMCQPISSEERDPVKSLS
jgi:hypothetical protein